jgi:predicted permease
VCRAALRVAAGLVPRADRRAWREEWEGELWALWNGGWGAPGLTRYAIDGLRTAVRLRWEEMMMGWVDDVRSGVRSLVRSPGFTAVSVVVLTLGVGASASIFSVLYAALLRSSPYPDAERLVMVDFLMGPADAVQRGRVVEGVNRLPFSWPRFEVLAASTQSVRVAGYTSRDMTLLDAGDPARVKVEIVTPAYFRVLGADAALGRTLREDEAPPASAAVTVLSNGLWRTRFGGDPGVLGRTVRINGTAVSVVGVMPADFDGLTGDVDAWVSMALAPHVMDPRRLERLWSFWFFAVGRVPPEVGPQRAAEDVARAGRAVEEAYPADGDAATGATTRSFLEARVNPDARLSVLVLTGASLLLLAIACANVAGLLVARANSRRHELAVRAALGAARSRLARGHLVESVTVSLLGAVLGLLLAAWAIRLLAAGLPRAVGMTGANQLRFLDAASLHLDGPVVLFALGAALVTGLIAGLWPALRGVAPDAVGVTAGARSVAGVGGRAAARARSILVAAQLALALVLLAGTGLMLGSLARLEAVEIGVDPDGVLLASYELSREDGPDEILAFNAILQERMRALPGVEAASVASCTPVSGRCDVVMVSGVEGRELPGEEQRPVSFHVVGDDYFATVGIPVLEGRALDARDRGEGPPAVVLSRSAARALFPGRSAVGRRIAATIGPLSEGDGGRVVGIVADAQYDSRVGSDPMPAVYVSQRALPWQPMSATLKTAGDPVSLAPALRREVLAIRPDVPLWDVTALASQVSAVTARTRVVLTLLAGFAGAALLLAAVGLYGLMSFTVSRRIREVGVRMALGARPRQVVGRILRQTAGLALVGAALGLAAAWGLTRLMEGLLFRVEPRDPWVLGGAALLLAVTALAAAWLPARRAAAVDPIESLRAE